MPDVLEAVAGAVAGLAVRRVQIKRLALVGPLAAAVVACDDRVAAAGRIGRFGLERRPQRRAGIVAGALAAAGRVLVEGVEIYINLIYKKKVF